MDVILVLCLLLGIGFCFHLYQSNRKLHSETETLDQLLRETLNAHEQELADHKESVQELALTRARLSGFEKSTFTPENAIPKDIHVMKVLELSSEIATIRKELDGMTGKFEESRGKQISERVRLGMIGEQFSTLHDNFKYNRKETKAILQPIDFVCFEEDEVIFVEVKTGDSGLSTKQRRIRDNIRAGRVKFEVFRINENGANWEE